MPWRAGSNENTTITFSHDVEIEGEPLAAGTYALFMAARGLQQQGQMDAANVIFCKNYEKNPGQWPVDFGMARVYSQEGDFEKALEHAHIAMERAPGGPQMKNLEAQIARLEEGENINP